MAIADTINLMKTNITNAYNAVQTKGGTIPTNKNLENLSTAINSITGGSSDNAIEEVASTTVLKTKITAENNGRFYYIEDSSTGRYNDRNTSVYRVYYYEGNNYKDSGAIVFGQQAFHSITTNLTHCITLGLGDKEIGFLGERIFQAGIDDQDIDTYEMPDSITVTGCSYTYTRASNKYSATIRLYNPTGNVTITITAKEKTTIPSTTAEIIAWYGSQKMSGFEPCINTWTSTQCQIWSNNFNTIKGTYAYVFEKLEKDPTEELVADCTKLLQNDLGVIFKSMGIEWTVKYDYEDSTTFTITQIMSNGTAASTGTNYIKG